MIKPMGQLVFFLIVIRTKKKNNNFFNAPPLSNDLIKVVYSLMIMCLFRSADQTNHTCIYKRRRQFYLIVDIIVIYVVLYIRTRDE